jgi:hypothetical protein
MSDIYSRARSGASPKPSPQNRHERRKAEAKARRAKQHTDFYQDYIAHLPQVPLDAPMGPGVYYLNIHHDAWCRYYETGVLDDCNCGPEFTMNREPVRS